MCGIIGYTGENPAKQKIIKGLKRLEYRGYDSAGIAVSSNPAIKTEKKEGRVEELSPEFDGTAGIGHNRWATHGEVNDTNAHPHSTEREEVAVVHNGIIENHEQLKKEIGEHKFESETDTEVIPHLLEQELEKYELEEALKSVMEQLEGSFAVAALHKSGKILAMRKDSPLTIGVSKEGHYIASDVTPFLKHTNQAIFLEDGDYAVIDQEIQIYNSGQKVDRPIEKINWDAEQASKEGYQHFMQKEIHEQKETIRRAVFQDRSDIEEALERIRAAETIYLTGCGTASYAAELGAKYLRKAGINAYSEQSHEFEYMKNQVNKEDLVIAVSQSGETADLLSALEKMPAETLAVTNVVGSTLARKANQTLYINAGPEIGVASTKAYTAQLTVLKLLGLTEQNNLEKARESLLETSEKVEQVLEQNRSEIEQLSEYLPEKDDVYFIGRNRGGTLAKEAALKLKELSYIHAEAFPAGEFKHGTLSLIEEEVPVVSFLTDDLTNSLSNAIEAESRGAELIGVGQKQHKKFEYFVEVPEDPNSEILEIIPFQLLAYKTALEKGNDPDKPRNLAKSVTVK